MKIDLEDILLTSHSLGSVRGAECDYPAEVDCKCGWNGNPDDYGKHLLTVLGLEYKLIFEWRKFLGRPHVISDFNDMMKKRPSEWEYSEQTYPKVTEIQEQEYLNNYRDPKQRRKITKEERKQGFINV